jgi:hypothetical protein
LLLLGHSREETGHFLLIVVGQGGELLAQLGQHIGEMLNGVVVEGYLCELGEDGDVVDGLDLV